MRLPSVKTLCAQFSIDAKSARIIRELMAATDRTGWVDTEKVSEDTRNHIASCGQLAGMQAISKLVPNSYGGEYIKSKQDTFTMSQGLDYVNMGDPYITTIIKDESKGTWRIACWGDIVERYPNRFPTED